MSFNIVRYVDQGGEFGQLCEDLFHEYGRELHVRFPASPTAVTPFRPPRNRYPDVRVINSKELASEVEPYTDLPYQKLFEVATSAGDCALARPLPVKLELVQYFAQGRHPEKEAPFIKLLIDYDDLDVLDDQRIAAIRRLQSVTGIRRDWRPTRAQNVAIAVLRDRTLVRKRREYENFISEYLPLQLMLRPAVPVLDATR